MTVGGTDTFWIKASDGKITLKNGPTIIGGGGGSLAFSSAAATSFLATAISFANAANAHNVKIVPETDVASFTNSNEDTSASILNRYQIESVTATKTPSVLESNEMYVTGDTDGQVFTLVNDPSTAGLFWNFLVTQTQASNSMSIAPSAGETLKDGTSSCSTLTATAIGSKVTIMVGTSGSGGSFNVISKTGTWTCNP